MSTPNSMVISMRLSQSSAKRLKRLAASRGWTPSDASVRLVEEGLRRGEFAFIDFRDSGSGRLAFLQGSSLAVWEVMMLAQSYGGDAAAVAKHLRWPEVKVTAAFNYAKAFPGEIEAAIADNEAADFSTVSRMLPQTREFVAYHPRLENFLAKRL